MNESLQLKLLWKILAEPDNTWVQVITNKYLRNSHLLHYKRTGSASWQWSKVSNLLDQFKKGLIWSVGNGRSVNFWTDNWLTQTPLCNRDGCPTVFNKDEKDSDYIIGGHWWLEKLNTCLPPDLVGDICSVPLPVTAMEDRLYWWPDKKGWFTTSSAYKMLTNEVHNNNDDFYWIWKLNVPPKIKNFLWKISLSGLPTKARLAGRGVPVPVTCQICNDHNEDDLHILVECYPELTTIFLSNSERHELQQIIQSSRDMAVVLAWIKKLPKDKIQKIVTGWWAIWYFRNGVIFRNQPPTASKTIECFIDQQVESWRKACSFKDNSIDTVSHAHQRNIRSSKQPSQKHVRKKWRKPPYNELKLNFDGSSLLSGDSSAGVIIRDWRGTPIQIAATKLGTTSPLLAEALALRMGIGEVNKLQIHDIIIEGDSKIIIDYLQHKTKCSWEIELIMSDIQSMLRCMRKVVFSHVPRAGNRVADKVAYLGHSAVGCNVTSNSDLWDLIQLDAIG